MTDKIKPFLNIEIGNIANTKKYFIKKGIIMDKSDALGKKQTPLTYYDNGNHISTNWTIVEEEPEYTYNSISKMWSLDGIDSKYECYYCDIPEECFEWINHLKDITINMTFKIDSNKTLRGDGTTGNLAAFFNWRDLYEIDLNNDKPEWPTSQEFIKIYRNNNELSFGFDAFHKDTIKNKNMKIGQLNQIYWRLEQEPYQDFYPQQDYDNDFLYPDSRDVRICRGWNTKDNINNNDLTYVNRFVPSKLLQEKYKNNWNIENCQKIETPKGNMIRLKLFSDKNGDVFETYTFKDLKIKISIPYYCYFKNMEINDTLQTDSVKETNNCFKHWSIKNYNYSMFTRKTEKIGNTTIQNSGLKESNRLSNMQRLWIALSGGKNLKDENGNEYLSEIKYGRDKLINILSPLQQLLWISWHTNDSNGTWKNYVLPNLKSGVLNENHVNIFLTEFLWLWKSVLEILPLSDNNLNTDKEISDNLGGEKYNNLTYYNKYYYYEIIKEFFGWPIPVLNSISDIINFWIPPNYTLNINTSENNYDLFTDLNKTIQQDTTHKLNLFYTIPPNTSFLKNNHSGYIGNYSNNHSMNLITEENFVNRINYSKTDNGWFSSQGNTNKYSIPILGKNKDESRITSDKEYMYRISDTAKKGFIRGKHIDVLNNNIDGTELKHGGLIVRLPEKYSQYSVPWNKGNNYIPKITKIKIEVDFAVKQYDENTNNKSIPITSIISTNPDKSLVYITNSNARNYPGEISFKKAWSNSGQWASNSDLIKMNKINFLNDDFDTNLMSISEEESFIDNARYKLIYTIDNLPIMNPGEKESIIDPLKSAVLFQIDYSKAKGQEHLGVKTFRINNNAKNKNYYDGKDGKPNYSIAPNIVGDVFKNDDNDYSFSVHKNNMSGLLSNENSKKHLGFYLFRTNAQSSYFFKNIKITLDIPELELVDNVKQSEIDNDVDLLDKSIEKAEKQYKGVIDSKILLNAKRKLSNMKILRETNIDNIETNDINIESLKNVVESLNINKNDTKQYKYQLQLENKLSFMKQHNKLLNVLKNKKSIKIINDILLDVKQNTIIEKILNETTNTVEIKNHSLTNKLDISKDIEILKKARTTLIGKYSKDIVDILKSPTYDIIGNKEYNESVDLLDELTINEYNIGEKSNINIVDIDKTPIKLYNELENKINSRTTVIINNINNHIINSDSNQNMYKIIDYILKVETENITTFNKAKYSLLLERYNLAVRHIKNTITVIIDEWKSIKNNKNLWNKKKVWFDWLGENTLNVSWEKSFYLNVYNIEIVQDYVDNVIKNLNLKNKNKFVLPTSIYSNNKGIVESSTPFIYPVDSYIYTFPSTQALRSDWNSNKYIKPFLEQIWIGNTNNDFIKRENVLGQTTPWDTPLGNLSIRLKNISESFNSLTVIARNGYPKKDRWHFPGIDITDKIINITTGTDSYPNWSYKNNNKYLKKYDTTENIIVLPPGPMTKLKNYLENDVKINKNAYIYKKEKSEYYDRSIWLYEFVLKYDTNTIKKKLNWISLSRNHGLNSDNSELITVVNNINTTNDDILNKLSTLTKNQMDNFNSESFVLLPEIKKQLTIADSNYIDDTFTQYKVARQLFEEQESILKNRLIMFTESATINNLDLLLDTIDKATEAKFNLYKDSNSEKTGIVDIYNLAIQKKEKFETQEMDKISNRLYENFSKINLLDNKRNIDTSISINESNNMLNHSKESKYIKIKTKLKNLEEKINLLDIITLKKQHDEIKSNKFYNVELKELFESLTNKVIEYNENILRDEINKSHQDNYNIQNLHDSLIYAQSRHLSHSNHYIKETVKRINVFNYENIENTIKLVDKYDNNDTFDYNELNNLYVKLDTIKNAIFNNENDDIIILSQYDVLKKKVDVLDKKLSMIIENISLQLNINDVLIEKNSNDITIKEINDRIKKTRTFLVIVNEKKLQVKQSNLSKDIQNNIDKLINKLNFVFERKTNGFYYNDGNKDNLFSNATLNVDFYIKTITNEKIMLCIKNNIYTYNIDTILEKQDTNVERKNKIFLSINDMIYFPKDYIYIINAFENQKIVIPDNSLIFYRLVNTNEKIYLMKKKYYKKITSTSSRMYFNPLNKTNSSSFNSFRYAASNMNKLHNFNMSKKNIRTNLSRVSKTGKQARVQANTGSMGRLARLKAKHS